MADTAPRPSASLARSSFPPGLQRGTPAAAAATKTSKKKDTRLVPVPPTVARTLVSSGGSSGVVSPARPAAHAAAPSLTVAPGARDAYFSLVASLAPERGRFNSDSLFCEAVLSAARAADERSEARGVLVAAAATWALNVLADGARSSNVWPAVRDALQPALFVRQRAAGEGSTAITDPRSPLNLAEHPFVTHDLVATRFSALAAEHAALERRFCQLHSLTCAKRDAATRIASFWAGDLVRHAFRGWRGHVRRARIERFTRAQRDRINRRANRGAMLHAAFGAWRVVVEAARCRNVAERLHAAQHHLENAKNQFQLQCFRSDKFLRTVEELRAELKELRVERDGFRDQARELERQLRQFHEDARAQLNEKVNQLLHTVGDWRRFARGLAGGGDAAEELLGLIEGSAAADSLMGASGASRSESGDEGSSVSSEEGEEAEGGMREADMLQDGGGGGGGGGLVDAKVELLVVDPPQPRGSATMGGEDDGAIVEALLLRWCNAICRESVVSQIARVRNFTIDFKSGEVLLFVMHHVFPAEVPYSPLQESNVAKRVESIAALGRELGLAHFPDASSILECMGDYNVMATAELFSKHVARSRATARGGTMGSRAGSRRGTAAGARGSMRGSLGSAAAADVRIQYDVDMLDAVLAEAEEEMKALRHAHALSGSREARVLRITEAVGRYAGYLARERLGGNPVQVLDRREVARFCRVSDSKLRDISFKYRVPPPDFAGGKWLSFREQVHELRRHLKKHFHLLRRVFKFYSGTSPCMTDADFWRFCSDIRVLDRQFTRFHVDRIFTLANMDDVPLQESGAFSEDAGKKGDATGDENKELPGGGAAEEGLEEEDEEENPATELVPLEFVECLVRIADAKIPSKMLPGRFDAFLDAFVIPFACKNEMDKFKAEIYSAPVQRVVQRHQRDLTRLFNHYSKSAAAAALGSPSGTEENVGRSRQRKGRLLLSMPGFVMMLSDADLLSGPIDEATVDEVFQAIRGDESTGEIALTEFYEVLVSCAVFFAANPFIGLDKKVDFLASTLIANLRPKLKGTIPLSDVRPMKLQPLQR